MNALTDRIAKVILRHSPITGLGYSRTRCGCGEVFTRPYVKSHAAHVAEQIEAATTPHPRCCVCGPNGDDTHGCCLHDGDIE